MVREVGVRELAAARREHPAGEEPGRNDTPLTRVDDGDGGSEARVVLARHLAGAQQALQAVADNRSMCAIGRSGQSFPAAKYHEGAVIALTELRRLVRQ